MKIPCSSRAAAAAVLWVALVPTPARADNCSGLTDCYGTILSAVLAVLGLALIIAAPYLIGGLVARFAVGGVLRSLLAVGRSGRIIQGLGGLFRGSRAGTALGRALSGSRAARPLVTRAGTLRNASRAGFDPAKLINYALNPNHPVGGNKARVFERALGYNQSNWTGLLNQIMRGIRSTPATAGRVDRFGARFTVDVLVRGPNGATATVRTGWIYRSGYRTPDLATLFIP